MYHIGFVSRLYGDGDRDYAVFGEGLFFLKQSMWVICQIKLALL